MAAPTAKRERALRRQGFQHIAGADEAGRGALAGPIVAAAVILPSRFTAQGIRDSKLLSPRQRQLHFTRITRAAIAWAAEIIGPEVIDRQGIQIANVRALERAVGKLDVRPDFALIDAWRLSLPMPHEGIVHGDRTVLSIAAASIIAKVIRDRIMEALDPIFPRYAFARHKGYGTLAHRHRITRHGPSPIHRRSFRLTAT